MKVVGLTGGIASGKSTVTKMLADLGAQTLSADDDARAVVAPGSPLLPEIERVFPGTVRDGGSIDRPALAAKIFASPDARAQLEAITHPAIIARMSAAINDARAVDACAVLVYEVPLLFEAGLERLFDAVIAVAVAPANQEQRLQERERLAGRPPLRASAVAERLAAQMPSPIKAERADYVVDNDGSIVETQQQVAEIWTAILSDHPSHA